MPPVNKIKTAMLIDDSEADQLLYSMVMERSGYIDNVITFTYADEALDYIKQPDRDSIDVIFLDINMPRMDGFEFLEAASSELGDKFAKAVIVMLTTSLDPKDHERADHYSVVKDFINKPLTVEHIENVIKLLSSQESI